MIYDFMNSLQCISREEESDYQDMLNAWKEKINNIALMPTIWWYEGTFDLFDQKGMNLIWIISAGQDNYY